MNFTRGLWFSVLLLLGCLTNASFSMAQEKTGDTGKDAVPKIDKIKMGEFWYSFEDAKGKTTGYALLNVGKRKESGLSLRWEMRVMFETGAYEEDRTLEVDSKLTLIKASYTMNGLLICQGLREGDKVKGKAIPQQAAEVEAFEIEIKPDALSGMAFVLIAGMPREVGTKWTYTDVAENRAFKAGGEATVTCLTDEIMKFGGKDLKVWRYDLGRKDRATVSVWVDEIGRVAKAQWGKDTAILSEKPTKDLYKKVADALAEVEGAKDRLVLRGEFAEAAPAILFDWFTKSELLTKWWPQRAEIDLKVGGKYHLIWDNPKFMLRSEIKAVEPGKSLTFTWKWDGTSEPDRTVELSFEARKGGGCIVNINHGPYGDDKEEQLARDSVKQGWIFFGNKLRAEIAR